VLARAHGSYRAEPRRPGASGPLQRVAAQLGPPREVGVELLLVHGAKPHPCIARPATPVSPQAARASSAADPSTRLAPPPPPPSVAPTHVPTVHSLCWHSAHDPPEGAPLPGQPLSPAAAPSAPSRTNWTRLVPPSRTNWTRLVPPWGHRSWVARRTPRGGTHRLWRFRRARGCGSPAPRTRGGSRRGGAAACAPRRTAASCARLPSRQTARGARNPLHVGSARAADPLPCRRGATCSAARP
jgi:hypothetical protein